MAEKVIHEMRFVETDDGFRFEVKGDKEKLREMFGGMPFGPGFFARRWRWGRRRQHGRHHRHHRHHHRWGFEYGEEAREAAEETTEKA